jgi:hypothetical protein
MKAFLGESRLRGKYHYLWQGLVIFLIGLIIGAIVGWKIQDRNDDLDNEDGFFGKSIDWCEITLGQSRWSMYNPTGNDFTRDNDPKKLTFGASLENNFVRLSQVLDPDMGLKVVGLFCEPKFPD